MIFSVSEANNFIKALLDAVPQLQTIFVRGEISNYKLYPSGHHYFTLKDEGSALKCVMFRGMAGKLRFRPENGMKVIAFGRIGVFPRDGAYQLYCSELSVEGVGDLHVAFEQLKEKLEEANVPDGQSWIVIPPFLKAQLVIAGVKFQINNGINGTGMIGYTNELGCDLFVSNQLAASGGKTVCLAGSYSAISYAEQVLETQVIDRLENSFDTAIRGRIVFGAKVIKPNELVACPVGNGGYSI